jgi:hypothetical protein
MLHMAFAERLQFRRDVLFTFGACGFPMADIIRRRIRFQSFVWELFSPLISGDLFMGNHRDVLWQAATRGLCDCVPIV